MGAETLEVVCYTSERAWHVCDGKKSMAVFPYDDDTKDASDRARLYADAFVANEIRARSAASRFKVVMDKLLDFLLAIYNDDHGISENAHNAFLSLIAAIEDDIDPATAAAFAQFRAQIVATDGRFYIRGGD